MSSSHYSIRRATVDDAALMSRIASETFVETFVETFGALYPPEDLQYFLEHSYSPEAQRSSLADAANAMWLLEDDGIAIGHAFAGPCGLPHPDVRAGDGELKRLYVLKRAHNSGWGGKLFQAALAWLERDGPRTLWIGVWSENFGAQRFYERHGFQRVGAYKFPVGKTLDDEFILRRSK